MYTDQLLWFALAFGLVIGSFVNVLIYRLPQGKSVVVGRSFCPSCQKTIAWYQNIPLVSWVFLRGACASCKAPISIRYPLVELLSGFLWMLMYAWFGFSYQFLAFALLSAILLAIFFIDLDHMIIPDSLVIAGLIIGITASLLPGGIGWLESLLGLLVGGGALYGIAEIGDRVFKKESMGGGDIKMAAMLGSFVGWKQVMLIFMTSAVAGVLISLAVMTISEKIRKERVIPFGPFLALAAMISVLYGDRIIHFYLTTIVGLPQ